MRYKDLTNVKAAGDYTKLPPGGYICRITKAEDFPSKEYLRIEYDIVEGEFKNYYSKLAENLGSWYGSFIRSYKDAALPFFKAFTTAVEKSNRGYEFDYDEHKLVGKQIGLILGEEEYVGRSTGEIKVGLRVQGTRSVESIKSGNYKVPELKRLQSQPQQSGASPLDDDIPF